jgi:hypothetical protein
MQRGERVADLRSVRAPRTVRPGQRIRVRVGLVKLRGARITRTYTIRIPRGVSPGRKRLVLRSAGDTSGSEEDLFGGMLLGGSGGSDGPSSLSELIDAIRGMGRFDGVVGRIGDERFDAFVDDDLLVSGRASTRVRVRRR